MSVRSTIRNNCGSLGLFLIWSVLATMIGEAQTVRAKNHPWMPVRSRSTPTSNHLQPGAWSIPLPRTGTITGAAESTDDPSMDLLLKFRGGATSTSGSSSSTKSKKKKNGKNRKKKAKASKVIEAEDDNSEASSTTKTAIDDAMKGKDAAEALGDAIRDRADVLRNDDPVLQSIDLSIGSVGQALGASDARMQQDQQDGGGVETAQSSVIANYFLKSHGGAHALQCLCSFLATISGFGAMVLHQTLPNGKAGGPVGLTYTMLQRTFLFAMLKHVSGMLSAASIAAKAVPKIGLSQSRRWMEQLVKDPVSQYVFFSALMLLWLPGKQRVLDGACWWWSKGWLIPMMIGPILVRESISNLLVISDVLVLWSVGETDESVSAGIQSVLKISQSVVNAVMSLVASPEKWRKADPADRQAILSKIVGKVSLGLEVLIGVFLLIDSALGLFGAAFLSGIRRPPFRESLTRLVCVRLYIHFLWTRRSQIGKLALKVRGGASQVPFWFLDVLYEPGKAMGIEYKRPNNPTDMSWQDLAAIGLGLADQAEEKSSK